jgi:hypothetical protein
VIAGPTVQGRLKLSAPRRYQKRPPFRAGRVDGQAGGAVLLPNTPNDRRMAYPALPDSGKNAAAETRVGSSMPARSSQVVSTDRLISELGGVAPFQTRFLESCSRLPRVPAARVGRSCSSVVRPQAPSMAPLYKAQHFRRRCRNTTSSAHNEALIPDSGHNGPSLAPHGRRLLVRLPLDAFPAETVEAAIVRHAGAVRKPVSRALDLPSTVHRLCVGGRLWTSVPQIPRSTGHL